MKRPAAAVEMESGRTAASVKDMSIDENLVMAQLKESEVERMSQK